MLRDVVVRRLLVSQESTHSRNYHAIVTRNKI